MIFVDANYFLRLLTDAHTPEQIEMSQNSARLFRKVRSGSVQVTTSDAVIAEVVHVLTGTVYQHSRQDVGPRVTKLLLLPGMQSPAKHVWIQAIDTWLNRTTLSFVDALAVSYALDGNLELATFDKKLKKHPGVRQYADDSAG